MRRIDVIILAFTTVYIATIMAFITSSSRQVAFAEPVDTYHSGWHQIEAPGAEDGASFDAVYNLDANGGDFASMGDDAFRIPTLPGAGPHEPYSVGCAWMFAFCGTDAADETFSFNLVGWARYNGPLQDIGEGNGALGAQDVVTYPGGSAVTNGYWADTLSLDKLTKWPEIGTYNDDGNDEISLLLVDLAGIEYIDFVFYDVGGGAEATSMGVYGRRY